MEWTNLLEYGTHVLNQKASQIDGDDASLFIHYWGAQQEHYNNKPHQHSFFEICYIINGQGEYLENGQTYPLHKGSLFLSRPYVQHQILSDSGLDILFVGFEINEKETAVKIKDLFASLEKTERFFVDNAIQSPAVKLWTSLLILANEPHITFNHSIQGLCSAFYSSILKLFDDQQTRRNKKQRRRASSLLVYQAKLYIRDNLSLKLRLKDVADHIHISERHLSRIFHAELGETFSSYVRKEKIRKAGTLLTDTDFTNQKISEITGFDNVHYFSNVFTSEMGMPPGKFRETFRQEQKNL